MPWMPCYARQGLEVDLAIGHLAHTRVGDLLVMDRNYPSYRMLAELSQHQRDFVIRCSSSSFTEARRMLKGEGLDTQVVTLTPCAWIALVAQRPAGQGVVKYGRI